MQTDEAIEFIRFNSGTERIQVWADLGCGSGIFTRALASLLPKGSWIHAVDIDADAIQKIPKECNGVGIKTWNIDFTSGDIGFEEMDGIIMANSLHYVKDKEPFLMQMMNALLPGGNFLLVDYDMNKPNQWVPYPLLVTSAEELFMNCGVKKFTVLNKRKSVFGKQWMYAALVSK